jgi:hypothetical protein
VAFGDDTGSTVGRVVLRLAKLPVAAAPRADRSEQVEVPVRMSVPARRWFVVGCVCLVWSSAKRKDRDERVGDRARRSGARTESAGAWLVSAPHGAHSRGGEVMVWFPDAKDEFPTFDEAVNALIQRKRDVQWFVEKMGMVSLRTEMEVRFAWSLLKVLGATTPAKATAEHYAGSRLHPDDCAFAESNVLESAYAFGMNASPESPDTPLVFADVPELVRGFNAGADFRAEMEEMERCTRCNDPEAEACQFHQ